MTLILSHYQKESAKLQKNSQKINLLGVFCLKIKFMNYFTHTL